MGLTALSVLPRLPLYLASLFISLIFLLVNLTCAVLVKTGGWERKVIVLVRVAINDTLFVLCLSPSPSVSTNLEDILGQHLLGVKGRWTCGQDPFVKPTLKTVSQSQTELSRHFPHLTCKWLAAPCCPNPEGCRSLNFIREKSCFDVWECKELLAGRRSVRRHSV